jgi:hypothetical protein
VFGTLSIDVVMAVIFIGRFPSFLAGYHAPAPLK